MISTSNTIVINVLVSVSTTTITHTSLLQILYGDSQQSSLDERSGVYAIVQGNHVGANINILL